MKATERMATARVAVGGTDGSSRMWVSGGEGAAVGVRLSFLRSLAISRADGSLTQEQIRPQLPPDLLLAVETLAEEIRSGNCLPEDLPLVILGNDWHFDGYRIHKGEPPAAPENIGGESESPYLTVEVSRLVVWAFIAAAVVIVAASAMAAVKLLTLN